MNSVEGFTIFIQSILSPMTFGPKAFRKVKGKEVMVTSWSQTLWFQPQPSCFPSISHWQINSQL